MLFRICKKCKKIVWFWDDCGSVTLHLKNGKKKVLHFCIDCGLELAKKATNAKEDA